MKYRIQLDTARCARQPERVQQYFATHLDWISLEKWAKTYLKQYPEAMVIVRENVEVERVRFELLRGELTTTITDSQDHKVDLTTITPI